MRDKDRLGLVMYGPIGQRFQVYIACTVKIGGNNALDGQKYKSQNQPVIKNLEMHDVS